MKRPPKYAYVLHVPTLCEYCGAKLFKDESINLCCNQGEIRLAPNHMPDSLHNLFLSLDSSSESFRKYIILYNNMFAFTSLGVKKDKELARRHHGIYTFRVQGQVYHNINDIRRNDEQPRYLQLYFYDTDVEYRHCVSIFTDLDPRVIGQLVHLMELNPYAQFFRSLKDVNMVDASHIIIRSDPDQDQRTHNAPTSSQVEASWLEDAGTSAPLQRDIVVHAHSGAHHRILHYYGCYDPLQYAILFPYGQTGWHRQIYRYKTKYLRRQQCHTFPINEVLVQTIDDLLEAEEQGLAIR
uniref:Helitron helicase-like domain-containing protein n=1 Tax=Chenopodium quinoa TaxID=63459 RepID=A0A803MEP6_CHEQI